MLLVTFSVLCEIRRDVLMATTMITASISTAFFGEVWIWDERGCQHKCHAPTLRRRGICDCCLSVGTTSFVLDCQRFPGCWMWMRLLVKPVGAADVQPGGALRCDRRPAEEKCTSSINHEARPRARRESFSTSACPLISTAISHKQYWNIGTGR